MNKLNQDILRKKLNRGKRDSWYIQVELTPSEMLYLIQRFNISVTYMTYLWIQTDLWNGVSGNNNYNFKLTYSLKDWMKND